MNKVKKIVVKTESAGKRLDIFLSENLKISRSQSQKMIEHNLILVNDKIPKKAGDKLNVGTIIKIKNNQTDVKQPKKNISESDDRFLKLFDEIKIVADEKDFLVIEKPAGLLVHSTEAKEKNTLVNWLKNKYPKIINVGDNLERPGIVHRLDKDTSGLLVVAKNESMFNILKEQFKKREVEKYYWALVYGKIKVDHGIIDFPIGRGREGQMVSRPKIFEVNLRNVATIQPGKQAKTEFEVEKRFINFTLLKIRLHTGRTHQIRAHMFGFNHPVVGDKLYFNKKNKNKSPRLFLHSYKLCFIDLTGEERCFESKLPVELQNFLNNLKV